MSEERVTASQEMIKDLYLFRGSNMEEILESIRVRAWNLEDRPKVADRVYKTLPDDIFDQEDTMDEGDSVEDTKRVLDERVVIPLKNMFDYLMKVPGKWEMKGRVIEETQNVIGEEVVPGLDADVIDEIVRRTDEDINAFFEDSGHYKGIVEALKDMYLNEPGLGESKTLSHYEELRGALKRHVRDERLDEVGAVDGVLKYLRGNTEEEKVATLRDEVEKRSRFWGLGKRFAERERLYHDNTPDYVVEKIEKEVDYIVESNVESGFVGRLIDFVRGEGWLSKEEDLEWRFDAEFYGGTELNKELAQRIGLLPVKELEAPEEEVEIEQGEREPVQIDVPDEQPVEDPFAEYSGEGAELIERLLPSLRPGYEPSEEILGMLNDTIGAQEAADEIWEGIQSVPEEEASGDLGVPPVDFDGEMGPVQDDDPAEERPRTRLEDIEQVGADEAERRSIMQIVGGTLGYINGRTESEKVENLRKAVERASKGLARRMFSKKVDLYKEGTSDQRRQQIDDNVVNRLAEGRRNRNGILYSSDQRAMEELVDRAFNKGLAGVYREPLRVLAGKIGLYGDREQEGRERRRVQAVVDGFEERYIGEIRLTHTEERLLENLSSFEGTNIEEVLDSIYARVEEVREGVDVRDTSLYRPGTATDIVDDLEEGIIRPLVGMLEYDPVQDEDLRGIVREGLDKNRINKSINYLLVEPIRERLNSILGEGNEDYGRAITRGIFLARNDDISVRDVRRSITDDLRAERDGSEEGVTETPAQTSVPEDAPTPLADPVEGEAELTPPYKSGDGMPVVGSTEGFMREEGVTPGDGYTRGLPREVDVDETPEPVEPSEPYERRSGIPLVDGTDAELMRKDEELAAAERHEVDEQAATVPEAPVVDEEAEVPEPKGLEGAVGGDMPAPLADPTKPDLLTDDEVDRLAFELYDKLDLPRPVGLTDDDYDRLDLPRPEGESHRYYGDQLDLLKNFAYFRGDSADEVLETVRESVDDPMSTIFSRYRKGISFDMQNELRERVINPLAFRHIETDPAEYETIVDALKTYFGMGEEDAEDIPMPPLPDDLPVPLPDPVAEPTEAEEERVPGVQEALDEYFGDGFFDPQEEDDEGQEEVRPGSWMDEFDGLPEVPSMDGLIATDDEGFVEPAPFDGEAYASTDLPEELTDVADEVSGEVVAADVGLEEDTEDYVREGPEPSDEDTDEFFVDEDAFDTDEFPAVNPYITEEDVEQPESDLGDSERVEREKGQAWAERLFAEQELIEDADRSLARYDSRRAGERALIRERSEMEKQEEIEACYEQREWEVGRSESLLDQAEQTEALVEELSRIGQEEDMALFVEDMYLERYEAKGRRERRIRDGVRAARRRNRSRELKADRYGKYLEEGKIMKTADGRRVCAVKNKIRRGRPVRHYDRRATEIGAGELVAEGYDEMFGVEPADILRDSISPRDFGAPLFNMIGMPADGGMETLAGYVTRLREDYEGRPELYDQQGNFIGFIDDGRVVGVEDLCLSIFNQMGVGVHRREYELNEVVATLTSYLGRQRPDLSLRLDEQTRNALELEEGSLDTLVSYERDLRGRDSVLVPVMRDRRVVGYRVETEALVAEPETRLLPPPAYIDDNADYGLGRTADLEDRARIPRRERDEPVQPEPVEPEQPEPVEPEPVEPEPVQPEPVEPEPVEPEPQPRPRARPRPVQPEPVEPICREDPGFALDNIQRKGYDISYYMTVGNETNVDDVVTSMRSALNQTTTSERGELVVVLNSVTQDAYDRIMDVVDNEFRASSRDSRYFGRVIVKNIQGVYQDAPENLSDGVALDIAYGMTKGEYKVMLEAGQSFADQTIISKMIRGMHKYGSSMISGGSIADINAVHVITRDHMEGMRDQEGRIFSDNDDYLDEFMSRLVGTQGCSRYTGEMGLRAVLNGGMERVTNLFGRRPEYAHNEAVSFTGDANRGQFRTDDVNDYCVREVEPQITRRAA